jgi:preprotein translocase subunit SecF
MEIIIAIVIAAGAAIWYFNRDKGLDVNKDGKVDVKDLEVAVENTVEAVKEEVKEAKAAVKKTATKAKATVKKAATKATTKAKTTAKAATSTGAKRGRKPKTGA